MRTRRFAVEAFSSASADVLFEILADIPAWHVWAGPLIRSSRLDRSGHPDRLGVGAVRKLGSSPFWSFEEITAYRPPTYLAYELRSGLPVRGYRSEVFLAPAPHGGTSVRWESSFASAPPGTAAAFTLLLRVIVGGLARRLVAYADQVTG